MIRPVLQFDTLQIDQTVDRNGDQSARLPTAIPDNLRERIFRRVQVKIEKDPPKTPPPKVPVERNTLDLEAKSNTTHQVESNTLPADGPGGGLPEFNIAGFNGYLILLVVSVLILIFRMR